MALQDDLRENPDVVLALATALEAAIGRETLLTIGRPRAKISDVIPDAEARVVALEFDTTDGTAGLLALVATPAFARTLETASPDEVLVTAAAPALAVAASTLATLTTLNSDDFAERVQELPLAAITAELGDDSVVYPLLDGTAPIACVAIRAGAAGTSAAPSGRAATDVTHSVTRASGEPFVLAAIEMGVTAELGRTHMTVRELLSIAPGAVIDLDRSVGAPVDLLVNGTAIARGEVVIIDEEFGVRITEILSR